ncbi:hypothetical protein RND71_025730 [Anisodus tanguticus]|uniref:Enoyl reductase (ER) domain-containing protein n=1 Tax=Anisodus tanguticus TaxID=243964 RepID=A0AAE1RKX6_9SOLA|nr:hypothetical protein RND71_025730 [Anisodus tanguticus]
MSFPQFIRNAICRSTSSKLTLSSRSTTLFATSRFSNRPFCSDSMEKSSSTTASAASYYHLSGGPSHMRAVVFWEPGKPLTFEDFHMPRPKANEVLIKTKACGVCHSDLHVIKGELPFASPCVVGHEITGEVVEHGKLSDSKIVERVKMIYVRLSLLTTERRVPFMMGKRDCSSAVVVKHNSSMQYALNVQIAAFFANASAKSHLLGIELPRLNTLGLGVRFPPHSCCITNCGGYYLLHEKEGTDRLGGRCVSDKPVYMYSMGGLAEYCVVPAHALAVLPNSLPYTESAILGCAVFTAYGAMAHAAEVRPGDAIAVIGIGGVGSSCLQIARAFGASEIIAVDVQDEKLQKAKFLGATHCVNAAKEDAVKKIKPWCPGQLALTLTNSTRYLSPPNNNNYQDITGGLGVDIAVEALGKPQTFLQCVQSVRDGGKAVMIGLTLSGAKGEVDINHLVRRQIKVIGSYGARARQDLPKLIKLAESGIFNLTAAVSRTCKFEEALQAYKDLDKGAIAGRAVVEIM